LSFTPKTKLHYTGASFLLRFRKEFLTERNVLLLQQNTLSWFMTHNVQTSRGYCHSSLFRNFNNDFTLASAAILVLLRNKTCVQVVNHNANIFFRLWRRMSCHHEALPWAFPCFEPCGEPWGGLGTMRSVFRDTNLRTVQTSCPYYREWQSNSQLSYQSNGDSAFSSWLLAKQREKCILLYTKQCWKMKTYYLLGKEMKNKNRMLYEEKWR